MRNLSPNILAHLNARKGLHASLLVRIAGIDKSTGLTERLGLWTGAGTASFLIDGLAQEYHGVGAVVQVPPLTSEIGLRVRTTRLQFSPIHPTVADAITRYDLRLQPVQMHVVYASTAGGDPIDAPVQVFDGMVAGLALSEPEPGGEVTGDLSLQSAAVHLTRTLSLRKSNAALRARQPNDRFRQYSDVSGTVETVWGEKRG